MKSTAPLSFVMDTERIRNDFDHIARLADTHPGGGDRYDLFLLSLVPDDASSILDIGCGLGRLTTKLAIRNREVTGVDLSPEMIARARTEGGGNPRLTFICGDFLEQDFSARQFDCVISAAVLHHMSEDTAIPRMVELLRPGGRLVIHDIRANTGPGEWLMSGFAFARVAAVRVLTTGSVRGPRVVREAWERHGADEKYLTHREAKALADRLLPGSRLYYHWLWSYTIAWDKPDAARINPGRSCR